ncbi:MAG: putative endonuclease [Parcubacteria group bacterium Athens0714_26]|nr:MAG: putative endonuclease [Parcubacteria group bacterium Athens1014_26]TSD03717.1 MAG: putative endonuclease [Parcubacteria group bacterium Athens0714_26]
MTNNLEVGQLGENIACLYLKNHKYKIIERNYRQPWGELDIVAKNPEGILVFVEVKTLCDSNSSGLTPEENLTKSKLTKLKRTMSLYAGSYPELVHQQKGYRLDLIAITIPNKIISGAEIELTKLYKNCVINYYENI